MDTTAARRAVAERVQQDGARGIRVEAVTVHPGVVNYQATDEIAGDASGRGYHSELELTERDNTWLIIYAHQP